MRQQYKVLSCFEQVALQQHNAVLQQKNDALQAEIASFYDGTFQRSLEDNVHDQISDYWNNKEAFRKLETEDNYIYLFIIVSFVSFLLGFVASYYYYV